MSDKTTKPVDAPKGKKFLLTFVNSQGAVKHGIVEAIDETTAVLLGRDIAKATFAKTSLTESVTVVDLAKFIADAEAAAKK